MLTVLRRTLRAAAYMLSCVLAADGLSAEGTTPVAPAADSSQVSSSSIAASPGGEVHGADAFETRQMSGFTVHVDRELTTGLGAEGGAVALRLLDDQLYLLSEMLPADRVVSLRRVNLWIERHNARLESMQYHPSVEWLRANGHDPRLARCVHIPRADGYVEHLRRFNQPYALLHELAHAYHDQVLGYDHPLVLQCFETARASGQYEKVRHIKGREQRHYALTNAKEYFAELTESFIGCNDFFPFVRGEIEHHDARGYAMLVEIWGPRR